MNRFTYYQIGLPVNDEPFRTKRDRWTQGQYPMRGHVSFTLVEPDKLIRHDLKLTDTSLFQVECETIAEADKAFTTAMGFSPAKTPKKSELLVSVAITTATREEQP